MLVRTFRRLSIDHIPAEQTALGGLHSSAKIPQRLSDDFRHRWGSGGQAFLYLMVMRKCRVLGVATGEQIRQQVENLLLVERVEQSAGHDGNR